jgi:hypothetical protein
MSNNKTGKYLKYALGEILLVMIGILLALQVNNWNEGRIQKGELDDLLKSMASSIKTDLRSLDIISSARLDMGKRMDSVNYYISSKVSELKVEEAVFISETFYGFVKEIYFQTNESAFQSLKNSIYFSKLQNTDIEALLIAYYTKVKQVEMLEGRHNKLIYENNQAWNNEMSQSNLEIFEEPYIKTTTADSYSEKKEFFKILRNPATVRLISNGRKEPELNKYYNELELIGRKFIKMVEGNVYNLNEQDKLELSGVLPFIDEEFFTILYNGQLSSLFFLYVVGSSNVDKQPEVSDNKLEIYYPDNMGVSPPYTEPWLSVQFFINVLNDRILKMDMSMYSKLIIEMKGKFGGEKFQITVKDTEDPFDGSEDRVDMELTTDWQTFEVPLNNFGTADLEIINAPLAFVFIGDIGMEIHVRSVKFE